MNLSSLNPFSKQESSVLTTTADKKSKPTESKGAPGFYNYNGYIEEKEKNSSLKGTQKYKTYSNILINTSIVGAGLRYFLNLVAKAKWTVEPADDSPAAKEVADFVDEVINDMKTSWYRVVRRSAMYRFYGNDIQEWTAKRRLDGKIGLLDIQPRPQHTIDRWDTDEHGHVVGVIQRSPQTQQEIYLPREKIIYVVDDAISDSPEGLGIFRHIVEPSDRLKRYLQLEGFGFETDLRGIPVATAPLTALSKMVKNGELDKEQADAILKPMQDFVSNHIKSPKLGMVIDSDTYKAQDAANRPSNSKKWNIELLKAGNNSQGDIANAISRINFEMAMLLGVEHLLLGSDGGTQALSKDKSQNLFLIVDSTLNELGETLDKDVIDPIIMLNGIDEKLRPKLKPEEIKFKDIEQITQALRDMAQAGAPLTPNDPAINEVRALLGLSKVDFDMLLEELSLGLDLPGKKKPATSKKPGANKDDDDVKDLDDENDDK